MAEIGLRVTLGGGDLEREGKHSEMSVGDSVRSYFGIFNVLEYEELAWIEGEKDNTLRREGMPYLEERVSIPVWTSLPDRSTEYWPQWYELVKSITP